MRISDWSSDVCSSDLIKDILFVVDVPIQAHHSRAEAIGQPTHRQSADSLGVQQFYGRRCDAFPRERRFTARLLHGLRLFAPGADTFDGHPSSSLKIGRAHVELQSLMRISYAVFCLTQKQIKLRIQSEDHN